MHHIQLLLKITIAAIWLAFPLPASAITINEVLDRIENPDSYDRDVGRARAGLLLSLSTTDNWQTADFDLTIRTHLCCSNDLFFQLGPAASISGIVASDFHGTGFIDYFDASSSLTGLFMTGVHNNRMGFSLSSTNPGYTVWDALSAGFRLEHFFFGGEYLNLAQIRLTYPGITAYRIQLGDAAAVPVPPAIGLALGALGWLAWVARGRKKSAQT